MTERTRNRKMRAVEGTMRAILVCVGLLFCSLSNALAQPVYFLVDASKSMDKDEQAAAAKFIAGEKATLPVGTLTSTTFFGSKENGGASCGDVTISPLRAIPDDVPEAFTRGDFTPVGNALQVALDAAAATGGRVVMVSDGADTCEVDVCEVVRSHMRLNPRVRLPEFKPIGAADDTLDTYGCFVSARRGGDGHDIIGGGVPPPERADQLWWIIPLFVINGFLFSLAAVLVIATMGARSRDLSAQVKGLLERGTAPAQQVHFRRYILAWLPALVALVITMSVWLTAPSALGEGWNAIWWFMNQPSGSMLLPAALLGFFGWALAAAWDVMAKRRQLDDAEIKVKLAKQRRQERDALVQIRATARENARLARLAENRAELLRHITEHRDVARELELEQLESMKSGPEDPNIGAISQKVTLIVDRLEAAIAGISENKHLQRFDIPRTDYRPVLRAMMSLDLIGLSEFKDLTDIFRAWNSYKRGESILHIEEKAKIEAFDVLRIATR